MMRYGQIKLYAFLYFRRFVTDYNQGVRVCTETECGQCARLWACLSVFVMSVHVYNFYLPALSHLFSACFKWHKCRIVKRHTYIRGADQQPNTNTGFFWIPRSVDCSDFEHNATWHWKAHYMRMTQSETIVYSIVSVSPWQSPASPWT